MSSPLLFVFLLFFGCALSPLQAQFKLRFPTENKKVLTGDNAGFYMYVDRTLDGVKSTPWQAGSYGFVRTVVQTPEGPVCCKFHEGIDIIPLQRTPEGTPLDVIHPAAPAKVAHVSDNPRASSYGRYIVLEHPSPEGPLYTLYAHLASTSCQAGEAVGTGNDLGILGYSGVGLNKTRAHLHFETALMINPHFEAWYDTFIKGTPNKHGNFNGLNLAGFAPVPLLKACHEGMRPTLSQIIASQEPAYVVQLKRKTPPPLTKLYPFLLKNPEKLSPEQIESWLMTFSGEGVPLSLTASAESVSEHTVRWVKPSPINPLYRTNYRIKKDGPQSHKLTLSGQRYIDLFLFEPNNTPE